MKRAKAEDKLSKEVQSLTKKLELCKAELDLYKSIVENSKDGILLTAPALDGKILYANPAICEVTGRTKKEICKLDRNGIADLNDQELIDSIKIRNTQNEAIREFHIIRKDGNRIPTELSFKNFQTPDGIRTSVIIREISERKKFQEKLRLSEMRYRKLFENSMMGISHVAENGTLLNGNDAYSRIYGYDTFVQMAAKVKNVKSLYLNVRERKEVINTLNKSNLIGSREFCVKKKDGTKAYVLATIQKIYDDKGNHLYNEATHLDITEKKKLELSKQETEEIFRNTINNAPIVIYAIERNGIYILSEGKGLYKTGLKPGEIVGTSALENTKDLFVTLSDGKTILFPQLIKKIFKGQRLKGCTVYNNVHFEHQFIPIWGKQGKVETMLGVATDISDIKEKEEEIFKSRDKLRALSTGLQQVREEERLNLARELHDNFGQSLTGIKMDLAWLMKRISKTNKNFDIIYDKVKSNIALLDSAIKDIRKISTELRPIYLDTLGLISAIEWQLEELKKRTELKILFTKNVNKIDLDQVKATSIYRIVQESLTNIIHHSKATRVNFKILKKDNGIRFEIADNGVGITNKQLTGIRSLGIIGMRERAYFLGSRILITGKKNKGTKIILSVPLEVK